MYCVKCGKEIPDLSKYCPECGANLELPAGQQVISVQASFPASGGSIGIKTAQQKNENITERLHQENSGVPLLLIFFAVQLACFLTTYFFDGVLGELAALLVAGLAVAVFIMSIICIKRARKLGKRETIMLGVIFIILETALIAFTLTLLFE